MHLSPANERQRMGTRLEALAVDHVTTEATTDPDQLVIVVAVRRHRTLLDLRAPVLYQDHF